MIHSISIENFRSFPDLIEFDLKAHGSKLSRDFQKSSNGFIYTNVAAILGPNGSGKSNLIDAIKASVSFIKFSLQDPDVLFELTTPHRLKTDLPTSFNIEFEINQEVYSYFLKAKKGKLIEEKLTFISARNRVLFHRVLENGRVDVVLNDILPVEISKTVLPNDASVITVGGRFDIEPLRKIYQHFVNFNFDTRPIGLERRGHSDRLIQLALQNYANNSEYLDRLNYIIQRIDLGIRSVSVEQIDSVSSSNSFLPKRRYKMILNHDEFSLDLSQESSGTRCIIYLLNKIFTVIDRGGVLISDELENHFHDNLFEELIGIFKDSEYNTKGAQLIFSTNSTYALTFINKYQVYLVEKNRNKSELYRMSEFTEIRDTNNLEKNYRSGKYGAVPKLRNIH